MLTGYPSRLPLLLLGVLLACWIPLRPRAQAGQSPAIASQSRTNGLSPPGSGPATLEERVQIKVESNAPPVIIATNGLPRKEKAWTWEFNCDGWEGVRLELTRKTWLGELLPTVTNLEQINLADEIWRPSQTTNRYRLRLEEARMSAKIGGKLALDGAAFVTATNFNGFDNGAEMRRARLYAKGDCLLLLPVSYQLEVGYIPNEFYIEESYLAFKEFPRLGTLKIGQYQAPMGLDVVNSSRDITFMEPAAPLQALAPGVNAGFQLGRPVFEERATWAVGFFTDGVGHDFGDATKDYGRAITRFTGLPVYHVEPDRPEATELLHLGVSANILYSANSSVQYRSRPESHLAPYVIDTGEMSADGGLVVGAEAAWIHGPLSLQSEFLRSWVREINGEVPEFYGFYGSVGWFLTGESRPYDRSEGIFGRVIPRQNFNWGQGGWGAWELVGRYSSVNLNSADVQGGRLSMLMAGVNWYLHSHVKCRFDYGFGHVSGRTPEGNLNLFESRVEIDF